MSGGKVEDTNQKCAHVLIWSLFLLNAGVLKRVLRKVWSIYIAWGASRTSKGNVRVMSRMSLRRPSRRLAEERNQAPVGGLGFSKDRDCTILFSSVTFHQYSEFRGYSCSLFNFLYHSYQVRILNRSAPVLGLPSLVGFESLKKPSTVLSRSVVEEWFSNPQLRR